MGKFVVIFMSLCILAQVSDAWFLSEKKKEISKDIKKKVSGFTCARNCWWNKWEKRDAVARGAGMFHRRCSYDFDWGGKCYCFGPPTCV